MFVFLFGLGKGKMEMTLEKFNFGPGETIKGHVSLQLKKPVKARSAKVLFYGTREVYHRRTDQNGRTYTDSDTQIVYSFEMPLDGEKEYSGGEYDFEIKVPGNLAQAQQAPEGVIGDLAKAAAFLAGPSAPQPKWYVQAKLDIPGGSDVAKTVQVNIG